MKNLKEHPISTVLGICIVIFSGVLLFIETKYDLTIFHVGGIFCIGSLLCFAEEKFVSIITLGLDRFFKK